MHKTQNFSTSTIPKNNKKKKKKEEEEERKKTKSLKKIQNKIKFCTSTLCPSLECRYCMFLISQFKMFQTLKRKV